MSQEEENDDKDEKSIVKLMKSTLPTFSNETDWEMAIFELGLVMDRIWPHKDKMDIMEYMTSHTHRQSHSGDMESRADRFIYFALTTSAKKNSYAKMQIMASCHKEAVPCVMKNEGKKLFQMFQAIFTMTNLHQASLPTVRAEFYSISQKEHETILAYTSRVDIVVSTMAKLGERISTGAWIYALGNGLRAEFKESKDGILFNKDGYDTVLKVKTKLRNEEAVLTTKSKQKNSKTSSTLGETEMDDEIALSSLKIKGKKAKDKPIVPVKTTDDPQEIPDTTLFTQGKGGKGHPKGKGTRGRNRWNSSETAWDPNWNDWGQQHSGQPQWTSPPKGKGRGKDKGKSDPNTLWCDIHQKSGHSTDWCFDNPNRTGGPAPYTDGLWCDTCNRPGHASTSCFASTIRIPSKGKGKRGDGKGNYGDRRWKSQNFPANYNSDQATPALHDESASPATQSWWDDHELGTAIVEDEVTLHPDLLNDDVEHNSFDEGDDEYVSDYIDLILLAIIQQVERYKTYHLNPTPALFDELQAHEAYISNAESSLNVHIVRIIQNFKTIICYDTYLSSPKSQIKIDAAYNSTRIAVDDDDLTQSPIVTARTSYHTYQATEQLNDITNAQASKNDETSSATERANESTDAKESTNDDTSSATERVNEFTNAKESMNDATCPATEQLNELEVENENEFTIDNETYPATERVNEFTNATESTNDAKQLNELDVENEHEFKIDNETYPAAERVNEFTNAKESMNDATCPATEQVKELEVEKENEFKIENDSTYATTSLAPEQVNEFELSNVRENNDTSPVTKHVPLSTTAVPIDTDHFNADDDPSIRQHDIENAIARTRQRLATLAADVVTRTDNRIDAIVAVAIERLNQSHTDDEIASAIHSIDQQLAHELLHLQHKLTVEMERIQRTYHDLNEKGNDSPTDGIERPTLSRDGIGSPIESPTLGIERPTLALEGLESPTSGIKYPTLTHDGIESRYALMCIQCTTKAVIPADGLHGFEHIGVYDGTNNEFYYLYDSKPDALMGDTCPEENCTLSLSHQSNGPQLNSSPISAINPLEPGPDSLHGRDQNIVWSQLHDKIADSRDELISLLQLYGLRRNDLILMLRDFPRQTIDADTDEQIMRHIDDETNATISELLALELDEQRIHDAEVRQLQDDVLYHTNSQTDEIICEIERIDSDESDSGATMFNNAWYHGHQDSSAEDEQDNGGLSPASSDDDDNSRYGNDHAHDTDAENGAENDISPLQSNVQLISFIARQSKTIARLRKRILRLRLHISTLKLDRTTDVTTSQTPDTIDIANESSVAQRSPSPNTDGRATVLVETHDDTTLLIAPRRSQIITTEHLSSPQIKSQLATQLDKIKTSKANSTEELWMYFDSGASRSVISPHSPIRSQLHAVTPSYGSCSIGDGTPLHYIEKGKVNDNLEITVVKDLKYDLFSSVSAAKQGLTSIIDFDLQTGQNNSYTIDKTTGQVTPLVERGKGILELPLHLMLPPGACFTVVPTKSPIQDALPPHIVSMFWHH